MSIKAELQGCNVTNMHDMLAGEIGVIISNDMGYEGLVVLKVSTYSSSGEDIVVALNRADCYWLGKHGGGGTNKVRILRKGAQVVLTVE